MCLHRIKVKIASFVIVMLFAPTIIAKSAHELGLTDAQHSWLKAHPVIRLAPDINWPPFEWVSSDKQYRGIAADYMGLIENKLGIRFEVEKNKPWPVDRKCYICLNKWLYFRLAINTSFLFLR